MKKLFIAFIISAVSLAGCKSGGGDPKPVLMSFMDALNKQDFEGAKKYATAESASVLDMTKNMGDKKEPGEKYDLNNLEVGAAKIEGDMATIPVTMKDNGLLVNYKMKKESGAWKVAFDKASLATMGMDAMKQNADKLNINDSLKEAMGEMKNLPMDSIKSAMDQLKNLNIDSLKDVMKEGLKPVDTAQAHY